jgi:hypothetical protein
MFDERNKGQAIVFSANRNPGQPMKAAVNDGDCASLRLNGEDVIVRSIKVVGYSTFKGVIYNLEASHEVAQMGIELGDEVDFEEKHIIVCSEE